MKVVEIYNKYQVPVSLQEHMLRVAALAQIIVENWQGSKIDKEAIVQACLFHDIAKPMVFDLTKQAQYGLSEKDIENLRELQESLKSQYGDNEHQATVKICAEIGCSPEAVKCVENFEWDYITRLLKNSDIECLIPIYCDMRIGTKSILPLQERLDDLRRRTGEDKDNILENGHQVEDLLKNKIKVALNTITDNQLADRFQLLSVMEI